MDKAFQRIRSLMLRGTFYSVPPILLYGLFAVAAYVIKNAVEEKKREHRLLRYPLL